MKFSALFVFIYSLVLSTKSQERDNKCLPGEKHKEVPTPEDSLYACHAYKEHLCCTSDFTKQLANRPIRKIGNFSWTPCNKPLSPKCEDFLIGIECFYRCSHNAFFWENPNYPSAILNAPVCARFCDDWFDACKEDLTCAKNWLTGFNITADGVNTCKQPCRNFSDYYSDGKDLCENMWGSSFMYKETDCLQLNFTGPNPNNELVKKLFGENENKPKSAVSSRTASLLVFFPALFSGLIR